MGQIKAKIKVVAVVMTLLLTGCATVSRDKTQPMNISLVDEKGRLVTGVQCRLENSSLTMVGNTPLIHVPIERSSSDLIIECGLPNAPIARAIAVSRSRNNVGTLLQPLATIAIDHISGHIYSYPEKVQLKIGREVYVDADTPTLLSDAPLHTGRLAATQWAP